MLKKKSWVEKRENPSGDIPKVFKIDEKMSGRWGTKPGDTCAIATPKIIDKIMREVPKGKLITINEIRGKIAKNFKTTIACPITTGIFAWVDAWAAEEERAARKKDITPWWRTLKSDGSLNEKYPGDIMMQKAYLEAEGHRVIQRGKKYLVLDYEKSLVKI